MGGKGWWEVLCSAWRHTSGTGAAVHSNAMLHKGFPFLCVLSQACSATPLRNGVLRGGRARTCHASADLPPAVAPFMWSGRTVSSPDWFLILTKAGSSALQRPECWWGRRGRACISPRALLDVILSAQRVGQGSELCPRWTPVGGPVPAARPRRATVPTFHHDSPVMHEQCAIQARRGVFSIPS